MSVLIRSSVVAHLALAGTALAQGCGAFFDFEDFAPGTEWAMPAFAPGDLAFDADGVRVFLQPHSNGQFNFARIDPDPTGGACDLDDNTLGFNNINTEWDLGGVADAVHGVKLHFADLGGTIDLRVNDGAMWTGIDLTAAPMAIAPGVTLNVTQIGSCGVLELDGVVKSFEIGGQELWIDNVCVATCAADINADGNLDILDFVAFQNLFTAGSEEADCNGDGALNILDFVCYQNLFTAGC